MDSWAPPSKVAQSLAAPPFNYLSTTAEAADLPDLRFMHNKHVLLSCG